MTTNQESHPLMTAHSAAHPFSAIDAVLRTAIVGLTLSTAYIHLALGGMLFTLNAIGYVVLAMAMVAPLAIAGRLRWVVRIGLAGYAASTIVGWVTQGPYYTTAYVAKAIEVGLIVLLAIDFVRFDGNPIVVIRRELRTGLARLRGLVATFALAGLAVVVLAACSAAPGSPAVSSSMDPDALRIAAKDLVFSTTALTAPAGKPFQIVFDNQESVPHNVAIYRDASATEKVFVEEPFGGPRVVAYDVPALTAGRYFFRCDLHPDMKGDLTVD
jgi:plastocyanin